MTQGDMISLITMTVDKLLTSELRSSMILRAANVVKNHNACKETTGLLFFTSRRNKDEKLIDGGGFRQGRRYSTKLIE